MAIDWGYAERVDVDQVWAQAAHLYHSGDEVNEGYMVGDPIEMVINALYICTGDQNDFVTLPQVLDQLAAYRIPGTKETTMAVASVIRRLGADKNRKRINGKRTMLYSKMRPRREAGS